jgi:hypothetical protein
VHRLWNYPNLDLESSSAISRLMAFMRSLHLRFKFNAGSSSYYMSCHDEVHGALGVESDLEKAWGRRGALVTWWESWGR